MSNRNDEYEPDIQIEFDDPIDSEEDGDVRSMSSEIRCKASCGNEKEQEGE